MTLTLLQWWTNPRAVLKGVPFDCSCPSIKLIADALDLGWEVHLGELQTQGTWSPEEMMLHINVKKTQNGTFGLWGLSTTPGGQGGESVDGQNGLSVLHQQAKGSTLVGSLIVGFLHRVRDPSVTSPVS